MASIGHGAKGPSSLPPLFSQCESHGPPIGVGREKKLMLRVVFIKKLLYIIKSIEMINLKTFHLLSLRMHWPNFFSPNIYINLVLFQALEFSRGKCPIIIFPSEIIDCQCSFQLFSNYYLSLAWATLCDEQYERLH